MKEEFCAPCVAGIGALVGVGTAGVSSKAKKKWVFWIGVILSIISILLLIYFLTRKEQCDSCLH